MSNKPWAICGFIAIASVTAATILAIFNGECGGVIDCGTSQVPMKCHWAYIAAGTLGVLGMVASLIAIFQKETAARRVSMIMNALACSAILLVLYVLIGVCSLDTMSCVAHRIPIAVCCAVSIVSSIIAAIKADNVKANLPKRSL